MDIVIQDKDTIDLLYAIFHQNKDLNYYIGLYSIPIISLTAVIVTIIFSIKQIEVVKMEYRNKQLVKLCELLDELIHLYGEVKKGNFSIVSASVFNEVYYLSYLFGSNLKSQIRDFINRYIRISPTDISDSIEYKENFCTFFDSLLSSISNYLEEEQERMINQRREH